MSAAELRKAAETLRAFVAHLPEDEPYIEIDVEDPADAHKTYPGLGLALAALLDFAAETARQWEAIGHTEPSWWPEPTRLAHDLARVINGGAS